MWGIVLYSFQVLSIVLLGHQKRILVSLGDNRPGFNTIRRKQRANVSDISHIVRLRDAKVGTPTHDYFSHRHTLPLKVHGIFAFCLKSQGNANKLCPVYLRCQLPVVFPLCPKHT